jgi:hypothetical protein
MRVERHYRGCISSSSPVAETVVGGGCISPVAINNAADARIARYQHMLCLLLLSLYAPCMHGGQSDVS